MIVVRKCFLGILGVQNDLIIEKQDLNAKIWQYIRFVTIALGIAAKILLH
jgi:hypothetical protein